MPFPSPGRKQTLSSVRNSGLTDRVRLLAPREWVIRDLYAKITDCLSPSPQAVSKVNCEVGVTPFTDWSPPVGREFTASSP
jgi:hypothetical protein